MLIMFYTLTYITEYGIVLKKRKNILPFTKHVYNRTNYLGEDIVTFKNTVNGIFVGYFVIFNTLKV